jgi:hypothetical protein
MTSAALPEVCNPEQELLRASRPVYLHFLDREYTSSVGLYGRVSVSQILRDVRTISMSTYETLLISTSTVLESEYATAVLQLKSLLSRDIVMTLRESSVPDLIEVKREQYAHVPHLYPMYFNSAWEKIFGADPSFIQRTRDTTSDIEVALKRDLEDPSVPSTVFDDRTMLVAFADMLDPEVDNLRRDLVDKLDSRGSRAITAQLFAGLRSNSREDLKAMAAFTRMLSEEYVLSYIKEYQATTATGLSSGIPTFPRLAPTSPFHHLPLWVEQYRALGILRWLDAAPPEALAEVRAGAPFQAFVEASRLAISCRQTDEPATLNEWARRARLPPTRHTVAAINRSLAAAADAWWTILTERSLIPAAWIGTTGLAMGTERRARHLTRTVLEAVDRFSRALDRNPIVLASQHEPALRDTLVVALRAALPSHITITSESASRRGRTDILIQKGEISILLCECKRWNGPSAIAEGLAQLMKYRTLSDRDLCLILFSEARDASRLIPIVIRVAIERLVLYGAVRRVGQDYITVAISELEFTVWVRIVSL